MNALQTFFRYATTSDTVMRALKVALVVTPILTLLNHYDAIMAMELSSRFFQKVSMTFAVPYCVSTYSSAMTAWGRDNRATETALTST